MLEISSNMPADIKTMIVKTLKINRNYILKFGHLLDIGSVVKFIKSVLISLSGENISQDFLKE